MRHVLCLTALFLFLTPVFGQSQPTAEVARTAPAPETNDEKLIQQIEDELLKGENTTNVETFERVLADDYVNLLPRGVGPGKAEIIRGMRGHAGQAPAYSVETSDMHTYVLGDCAVAAYTKTYTAKENGNVAHEDTTHIFKKDQGAWRLKISRATKHQAD